MTEIIVPDSIRVLMPHGRVSPMKLETYLTGAVASAIGANAPLEALKAQAVASRTYAARAKRHKEQYADVCINAHCQKWKRVDPITAPEVFRAVTETWGTIAAHQGILIDVFFFEHCAGKTRAAEEMAMPTQPYLQSVECPCGFTEMKGHGVGMCQRGAIVLARQGASFKDILKHYFRTIEIIQVRTDVQSILPEETPAPMRKPRATRPAPAQPTNEFSQLLDSLNQAIGASAPPPPAPAPRKPAARKKVAIEKPQPAATEPKSEPTPAIQPPAPPAPSVAASEPAPATQAPTPPMPQLGTIHVDTLPGPRMIAGSLSCAGVQIEIENSGGWKMSGLSGTALHYGIGGFEMPVAEDGYYTVKIAGKIIELNVRGETVFLREEET